ENANKSDCYSEQDMYNELVKLADKGELDRYKIPKVQTIKGWISRYSRQVKKEAAEKASENHEEVSESNKRLKM
ncbi:17442_t:CDS:1, partial [Funneliformis caledonium]